jgi:Mn-dependent DtxR family transcriptional regulator/Fe2+ transport system protein FeoA
MDIASIFIIILVTIILVQGYFLIRLSRQSHRVSLGLDEIVEDTLKTIYHLTREQNPIPVNHLIRAADLQPKRWPMILSELLKRNWVTLDQNQLEISPTGEKRAIELIRAHRLWERYLADNAGLSLAELHDEAMRREHTTTPEEADRLASEMGNPRLDPHGDLIPTRDGFLEPQKEEISLLNWPEHRLGVISHVEDEPPATFSQLAVMGLVPGAQVEIDERTPGRVLIWSGRQRLALAPAMARQISVVESPLEYKPLSELENGQAGVIHSLSKTQSPRQDWLSAGLAPGAEIISWRTDPLGDPVIYRVDGKELSISRSDASQIAVNADSIREIPLPRHSWLAEEWNHFRELVTRYGSLTVLKRALLFLGPAFVISVGYMDPGNWGTDIEGGARFGYQLLWVILLANLMAILLQTLSAKLGIATGKSLPAVCRDYYPRWLSVALWVTAEIAAMATDLAEFLGGAVGFYLLFNIKHR